MKKAFKRAIDLIFAVLMTIIISPVLLCVALAIKMTSQGPVIFKQRRIGKDGAEFNIYKFRSMYVNAPSNKATHLLDNPDKYITPVGKILRKTSLDELPQLFNIIKGEMSFVGPRPALYNQYDLINLRKTNGVHSMRPGITGWAQINGRDELAIPVKVQYDKYYIDNFTLWLDCKIVIRTFGSVLMSRGIVEGSQSQRSGQI